MGSEQSFGAAYDYARDAWQRSILFLDVLRQRGNIYREQKEKLAPNVLEFDAEVILDGRAFARPVNYLLVRIVPPEGLKTDPAKRPFVVVDPRAGHGPGIGGMKDDSEIGAALKEGHPCYFIGFLPEPMPEQTIEDVWDAEAQFIQNVARRHPGAANPVVIANCQAGWQTMIMAAASSTARTSLPTSSPSIRRTPISRSPTTSIRRSTRKPSGSWTSKPGGAAPS